MDISSIQALIRDVPDFPKPGIVFKDITPLLSHAGGVEGVAKHLIRACEEAGAEELVAIESRGFLFGAAMAALNRMPLHVVRKAGKLPYKTAGLDYDLEYGTDRVEIHVDAIAPGRRYAVVDDLIATGGTAAAACKLVEAQGGVIAGSLFVIELESLGGRNKLPGPVRSLVRY